VEVEEEEADASKAVRSMWRWQLLMATATTSQYLWILSLVAHHTSHGILQRITHMVAMIWSSASNTLPCLLVNSMAPSIPNTG
jgi:hypothetical protein